MLIRWKQWKLEGAKIDKLTSTTSTEADAALKVLTTKVANLRFFARGKRSVLYAGELRSNNKPVVAKLAADVTFAGSVTLEARWLRVVNRMGIGARLIDAGKSWFLCERLEGKNVVEFLGQDHKVTTPANALWVIREMLCQVRWQSWLCGSSLDVHGTFKLIDLLVFFHRPLGGEQGRDDAPTSPYHRAPLAGATGKVALHVH